MRAFQIDTDEYVPFERLSVAQASLRSEIRTRANRLAAEPDEVLHAVFAGDKPARSDVENLLIYNVGAAALRSSSRHGLRFELAADVQTGSRYRYRYELRSRADGFMHWRVGRRLAMWDWIEVTPFADGRILAVVWLALTRAQVSVVTARRARADDTPFAVRVRVRPPVGLDAAPASLVKSVIDGTVCAFQAQTDLSTVNDLASRLAVMLPASEQEIARLLTSPDRAALGTVRRLLYARGSGVAWAPSDDLCLAAELLPEPAIDARWAIAGEIHEIAPIPSE